LLGIVGTADDFSETGDTGAVPEECFELPEGMGVTQTVD